jgi:ABC-2 type transport system ATP-binding protein
MNDPELVVLDEPMSGLDPIGRKEVRDLILDLRDRGKTVFFSTHILADVEAVADQVAIVVRGEITKQGTPAELVGTGLRGVDVLVRIADSASTDGLTDGATRVRRLAGELSLTLAADADVDAWLARAREAGAHVVSITPRHDNLEDLFLRENAAGDQSAAATEGRT